MKTQLSVEEVKESIGAWCREHGIAFDDAIVLSQSEWVAMGGDITKTELSPTVFIRCSALNDTLSGDTDEAEWNTQDFLCLPYWMEFFDDGFIGFSLILDFDDMQDNINDGVCTCKCPISVMLVVFDPPSDIVKADK